MDPNETLKMILSMANDILNKGDDNEWVDQRNPFYFICVKGKTRLNWNYGKARWSRSRSYEKTSEWPALLKRWRLFMLEKLVSAAIKLPAREVCYGNV